MLSGRAAPLRTHPGVGALTALAFVFIIGRTERFQCGKQIAAVDGALWKKVLDNDGIVREAC